MLDDSYHSIRFLFQTTNVIEFYFQAQVQSKFIVRARVTQPHITSQQKFIFSE